MTNELEKQFFDTFGIEPKYDRMLCDNDYQCNGECNQCEHQEDDNKHKFYPQITDTHYLKLICELSKCKAYFNNFYRLQNVDIEQLKEQVLTDCIFQAIFFKDQVRTLFEEG